MLGCTIFIAKMPPNYVSREVNQQMTHQYEYHLEETREIFQQVSQHYLTTIFLNQYHSNYSTYV